MNRNPTTLFSHAGAGLISVLLCLGVVTGCAARRVVLAPAPTANLAAQGHGAESSADGVRIVVAPNAWNGRPANLSDQITPVKVTIENHSGRALRIRYKEFALVGPDEQRYAALPPSNIQGTAEVGVNRGSAPAGLVNAAFPGDPAPQWGKGVPKAAPPPSGRAVVVPEFDWDNYYVAPYWGYAYPGLGFWGSPWPPDVAYYDNYYPYMRSINLPTQSMLRKAIPEGVIGNGGRVSGFLYFEKVKLSKNSEEPIEFTAELIDANSGARFGTITIPLVAKK